MCFRVAVEFLMISPSPVFQMKPEGNRIVRGGTGLYCIRSLMIWDTPLMSGSRD